ncbi:hypothetical protein [Methanolapillus millepedarum]|uniref:hypothetical protein n=1 Tax=Methanolapillus millepedarum TaxID=3028296 RepID=UPI0030B9010A
MPPLSPPTIIKMKKFPLTILVENNKFYYKSNVMTEVCDPNQTFEHFGDEFYGSQRFRIVTKKMKELLIERFNETEGDFIPVMLVDENDEAIKNE